MHECPWKNHRPDTEPCWGPVEIVDDFYHEDELHLVYGCKGHANFMSLLNSDYIKEPVCVSNASEAIQAQSGPLIPVGSNEQVVHDNGDSTPTGDVGDKR